MDSDELGASEGHMSLCLELRHACIRLTAAEHRWRQNIIPKYQDLNIKLMRKQTEK
jgi:hypothetical protein